MANYLIIVMEHNINHIHCSRLIHMPLQIIIHYDDLEA